MLGYDVWDLIVSDIQNINRQERILVHFVGVLKVRIPEPVEDEEPGKRVPNIITTEEELEAYFIIKNLLDDTTDIHNVTYINKKK